MKTLIINDPKIWEAYRTCKNIIRIHILLLTVTIFFLSNISFANTIKSTASGGFWDATSTWSGGAVPGAADSVVLSNGATVTVRYNTNCTALVIGGSTQAVLASLIVNSGITLTISNGLHVIDGNQPAQLDLNGSGTIICSFINICEVNSVPSASSNTNFTLNSSAVNIQVTNNVTLNALFKSPKADNPVFIMNSGSLSVGGRIITANSVSTNISTFTLGTGSPVLNLGYNGNPFSLSATGQSNITLSNATGAPVVNYNGSGNQTIAAYTYSDLMLSNAGTKSLSANISVMGNWIRNGNASFNPGTYKVSFTGANPSLITAPSSATRNIYGAFGGEVFYDLELNKNTIDINVGNSNGTNVSIIRKLILTKGTLNLADSNFILVSNATGTANVDPVIKTNATVKYASTGRFIVQRYINNPTYVRTWRMLTAPLQASDPLTINQAWQESSVANNNPSPGFGTLITGPKNMSNPSLSGFDSGYASASNSIQYFENTTTPNKWVCPANTNTVRLMSRSAWSVFIRGDRSENLFTPSSRANSTILEPKGKINIGDTTYTINSGKFNLIGNPYPSQIDLSNITDANNNKFLRFRLWDPKAFKNYTQTGAYVLFYFLAGAWNQDNSGITKWTKRGSVESGEAFMVDTSVKSTTLTFHEVDKISASSSLNGIQSRPAGNGTAQLSTFNCKLGFYDNSNAAYQYIDGTSNLYYPGLNPNVDNTEDYISAATGTGTIRIARQGYQLYTDAEPSVQQGDTIYYNTNLNVGKHRLAFYATDFDPLLQPWVKDNYTGDSLLVTTNNADSTFVDFEITADPLSNSLKRFSVVFRRPVILPVTMLDLKATQADNGMNIEWNAASESGIVRYEIEHSTDGSHFTSIGTTSAKTPVQGISAYNWLDRSPVAGANYYRIKSVSMDGLIQFTSMVKIEFGNKVSSIVLINNPVKNNVLNLQFNGQQKGMYSMIVKNNTGQKILSKRIEHTGEISSQSLNLPGRFSAGIYLLEIQSPSGKTEVKKVVIE